MGSGHALQSLTSLKNNRILSRKHRNKYNRMKKAVSKIKSKYHNFNDKSELTPEQMLYLKHKIKKQIIRNKQLAIVKSALITVLVAALIIYTTLFLYNYFYG